jgi:6,7-dimethyl-8-ribityllumazine synthase
MKIKSTSEQVNLAASVTMSAKNLGVAVVVARFNGTIVAKLLRGVQAAWSRYGGRVESLQEFRVPGAFELPLTCRELAMSGKYNAVVALGCVIRGDTPHFEYVAGECARGLMDVGLQTSVPVIFGVLTVETLAQAEERADPARLDKGGEAVEAAIELAQLLRALRK